MTDAQAISNFREYLRIPSVHPNVDYSQCIEFLKLQASQLNLPIKIYTVVPKKPIVVISWAGTDPNQPAILLNSHMDVVPVFPENWTYPPFEAYMDGKGDIFARGAQDMKCVGSQYIETVRRLKNEGVRLKRTLHLSFVPDIKAVLAPITDEETGGKDGMMKFVKTDDFKALNIGFSLDEGIASPNPTFSLFYGERSIWHIHVKCPGNTGHGSLLHENTAGEKIQYMVNKFMEFRAQEKKKLENNPEFTIGDVTTVNLTQLKGGVQSNVVPKELTAVFDVRIAVTVNLKDFEAMLNTWCQQAGEGVHLEYEQKEPQVPVTNLNDSNIFWVAFQQTAQKLNLALKKQIFPGGTDSRYVRELGIPAIGFSPMNNTPILLHDNNEFLNKDVFLNGIRIYKELIPALANV